MVNKSEEVGASLNGLNTATFADLIIGKLLQEGDAEVPACESDGMEGRF